VFIVVGAYFGIDFWLRPRIYITFRTGRIYLMHFIFRIMSSKEIFYSHCLSGCHLEGRRNTVVTGTEWESTASDMLIEMQCART